VIYVTGHRNPDTDSIAAAIGYSELMRRIEPESDYLPVRLGEVNAQTRWLLERSGAPEPELLEHVYLRVSDVMRERFPTADHEDPVRQAGLAMASEDLDLVPVVGGGGELAGVVTERALARRYIRESREVSSLVDAPTAVAKVRDVLEGDLVAGNPDEKVAGRVWAQSMDVSSPSRISAGDVVVVGDRPDAQRLAIERGASLLVTSNGSVPTEEIMDLARERGTAVISSPLDTYVSSRMITLAAPCEALMDREPLTVSGDDLLDDIADRVKDVHYRAAVAVDGGSPIGLITRSDLLGPQPRRVLLVDHAEQAQSVPGVEEAEIVEILDHHHVGSVETTVPVRATFDPVGSTATLVIERFRQNGMEPTRPTAVMLLGAIHSDTVILNSPTTTERDRAAVDYLGRVLGLDAIDFGREMFEATSDVTDLSAEQILDRDAKEYDTEHGRVSIAQVETVGTVLLERKDELLEAMRERCEREGFRLVALMITDIHSRGTELLVAGDASSLERAFGETSDGGVISLPGVMSRKKQVAPKVLTRASA
jgi:manganese-dependent inorganic pyrophosphatase